MASSTSSFRISAELKLRLDRAVRRMKKKKNWIINRALQEYLDRHSQADLRGEARRQSLAAGQTRWKEEKSWQRASAELWND